jgi:hypothetical protein
MVVMATTAHHREIVERTARTILHQGASLPVIAATNPSQRHHIRLYPLLFQGGSGKAAPVDIIGPQATSQFDALLAAQRDLQQQAKNDPAWSKQR